MLSSDLPTPGYGGIPVYAACWRAASPFGNPCAGMDRCRASIFVLGDKLRLYRGCCNNATADISLVVRDMKKILK